MIAADLAPFINIQGKSKAEIAEEIAALLLKIEDLKGRCATCETLTQAKEEIAEHRERGGELEAQLKIKCQACRHYGAEQRRKKEAAEKEQREQAKAAEKAKRREMQRRPARRGAVDAREITFNSNRGRWAGEYE